LGHAGKPVWLIESGFPAIELEDPPDSISLEEDMIYFSENRQDKYISDALNSAVENGINGFFYFSLTAEEDENVGGGGALNTYMRFSGLIRKDTDEQKAALVPFADLYNELVMEVGIEPSELTVPQDYVLYQNYPNPFNPTTTIRFSIETQSDVFLHIYDIKGRLVETLVTGELLSGDHAVQWDASDYASGVYFVRLTAGESRQTRKMLLVK